VAEQLNGPPPTPLTTTVLAVRNLSSGIPLFANRAGKSQRQSEHRALHDSERSEYGTQRGGESEWRFNDAVDDNARFCWQQSAGDDA